MIPIDVVIGRLREAGRNPKESGGRWTALCPAHDDHRASLSIGIGDDGRVLLRCHAGCRTEDVCAALGLELKDLFAITGDDRRQSIRETSYMVRDRNGDPVAEHVRREFADGSKDFLWRRNGSWGLRGLKTKDLPLFGVEDLRVPGDDSTFVVVVEGEKAAEALKAVGVLAVGTVTGAAATPSDATLESLKGHLSVLWPDNDPEGAAHMNRIGSRLTALGTTTRIIEWSDAPPHGDAADFLELGGTIDGVQELIDRSRPISVECVEIVAKGDWDDPLPLTPQTHEAPPFPLDTLPASLREFVVALADQAQVPEETAAGFCLAATSLAICRRFVVSPWDGWEEETNLWIAVTADSGTRKSSVSRTALAPLHALEEQLRQEMDIEIAQRNSHRRILKKALDGAEKAAAKNGAQDAIAKAQNLAVEYDQLKALCPPRLVAANATSEGMAKLLADNDGRLLVASAEGAEVITIAAGLYTQGRDNYDLLLKGWSGDAAKYDRRGADAILIPKPTIAMALMFQPNILRDMADHPSFRGRGFIARFLFILARSIVGRRKAKGTPIPETVKQTYADMLGNLLRIPDERDENDAIVPRVICFEPTASDRLVSFFDGMESAQREFGPLEGLRDWASKAHGQAARLAAILHMADHHDEARPQEIVVSDETASAAITLVEYFLAHAKAAFALMGEDPIRRRADKLARYLAQYEIKQTTKRDIHRALPTLFEKAHWIDPVLKLLEEHSYVRVEEIGDREGPGRKPSPTVHVNPKLLGHFRHIRQNPLGDSTDQGSVESVESVEGDVDRDEPEGLGRVRF